MVEDPCSESRASIFAVVIDSKGENTQLRFQIRECSDRDNIYISRQQDRTNGRL